MEIKLEKIEFGTLRRSVIFLYGSEVAMRSLPFKREESAYVEERRKRDISSLVVLNRLPQKIYVQNFDSEKPSGETLENLRKAAAELCYHAAVAAQANWNSLGGGTFDENILSAMINNFSYNPSAQVLNRPLYDEPAWMEMIYRMLSDGHPVLYSGKDINFEVGILVGHNFIIDGYDENGLVHVNWGWHGQQDGYFDIATLQVGRLSFDDWQGMYLDLYPTEQVLTGDVNCDGSVTATDVTALYEYLLNGDTTFLSTSDVDGDGTVTSADVTKIYDILLGI